MSKNNYEKAVIASLANINEKLEKVMKLLALNLTNNNSSVESTIMILSSVGITSKEIGEMVGLSSSRVRGIRSKQSK